MAVAYAKLYELIYRYVEDRQKAEEFCKVVDEIFKEQKEHLKESKSNIKNELRDELRNELSTKEDILLLKKDIDLVREEMVSMEERLMRYTDNKFNQMDKKMTIGFVILIILNIRTNPNAIELIKLLFGLK